MKTKRNEYFKYTGTYTFWFCLLMAGMLLPMILGKRSLIWNDDAKSQYYLQLSYMGKLLREFVRNLLHGRISLRMYDFTNGMGDDVNTLVRWHPLDFLSVFVPAAYTKYLYGFLILLRIYLAGLAFSAYCFHRNLPGDQTLIGSMVYVSCGYVLKLVLYHPTFGSAIICLPLLQMGAEEVMEGRRGRLFSFFVFLSFTSNYYFTYMAAVAVGIYVLCSFALRAWDEKWNASRTIIGLLRLLGRFAGYALLGAGMAALTLLPILSRLHSSSRVFNDISLGSMWRYPLYRYGAWVIALISPYMDIGSISRLNFAVPAAPALLLLFLLRSRKHRLLRRMLVLELVLFMVPAFGYLMSGFSNVNNRWTYIIAFTVSVSCAVMAPELGKISVKHQRWMVALALGMAAVAGVGTLFASRYAQLSSYRQYLWIGAAQCAGFAAALLVIGKRQLPAPRALRALTILTALSCVVNGFVTYDSHLGNTMGEFMKLSSVPAYYESSALHRFKYLKEDGFFRVDTDLIKGGNPNLSLYYDYQGCAVYNSVLNEDLMTYLLDQENPGQNGIIRMNGLDGRTAVENLANVSYYLTRAKTPGAVPEGFAPVESLSTEKYTLYRNQNPLSFGYTYDALIPREDYEQLPPLARQQVMLEAAVVETPDADNFALVSDTAQEILCVPGKLPTKNNKRISTTQDGYEVKEKSSVRVSYRRKAGYECYVRLVGLTYEGPGMVSNHAQMVLRSSDGTRRTLTVRGEKEAYYLPRDNYLICLGTAAEDSKEKLKIKFRKAGTYHLEGIEFYYVPTASMRALLDARGKETLRDVEQGVNTISGTAEVSTAKYMVFSIPYSSGWRAQVDGKAADLQRANVCYLGLPLEAGTHRIVLTYVSPGLIPGFWIALLSWGCFLGMGRLRRKLKKA